MRARLASSEASAAPTSAAHRLEIAVHAHPAVRTSSMCTSTARTGSPVSRSTSYATRLRDARGDLGEVEAVLDDDVEVDGHLVAVAADLDAARPAAGARELPRAARHPDDAVALARRLARRSARSPRSRS